MTVRNILHWFFSFPQAIVSGADRAKRGLIGAKFQQDFAPGGLGEISPNKQQVAAQLKCNFNCVRTLALPCKISGNSRKARFCNGAAVAF